MTRITIADSFESVEVDLLGTVYKTIPITRSVQQKAVALEKESGSVLNDVDASPDSQVEYLAKQVGMQLVAVDPASPVADKLIVQLYKDDKLRLDQLVNLIEQLGGSEPNPTQ